MVNLFRRKRGVLFVPESSTTKVMKKQSTSKDIVEIFDSPIAFVETINKRERNKASIEADCEESKETGEHAVKFRGTKTYEEANSLFYTGVKKDIKLLDEQIKINMQNYDLKTTSRYNFDYVGGGYSLGRYLANCPNCMVRRAKVKRQKPTISIMYNCGVDYSVTKKEILKVNSQFLSAIKIIEQKGIKVNLFVLSGTRHYTQNLILVVKVKDATTPINLATMSYILIHPSFDRRHVFRWMETVEGVKVFNTGYGYVVSNSTAKNVLDEFDQNKFISFYDIQNLDLQQTIDTICEH